MQINNSGRFILFSVVAYCVAASCNCSAIAQSAADAVENAPLKATPVAPAPTSVVPTPVQGKAFGSSLAKPLVGDPSRPDAPAPQRDFKFTNGFGYDAQSQKVFEMLYSGHGTDHPIEIGDTEPQSNAKKGYTFADDKDAQRDLNRARNGGHWDPDFNQAGYNLQQLKDYGSQPSAPAFQQNNK